MEGASQSSPPIDSLFAWVRLTCFWLCSLPRGLDGDVYVVSFCLPSCASLQAAMLFVSHNDLVLKQGNLLNWWCTWCKIKIKTCVGIQWLNGATAPSGRGATRGHLCLVEM